MITAQIITSIIEIILIAALFIGKLYENKLIAFENKVLEVIRRK